MEFPAKGDIILINLNPQIGHEQDGKRPALVVSEKEFNETTGFAWVCPITSKQKGYPFELVVTGAAKTNGVILTDQLKALDIQSRGFKIVDKLDQQALAGSLHNLSLILGL